MAASGNIISVKQSMHRSCHESISRNQKENEILHRKIHLLKFILGGTYAHIG